MIHVGNELEGAKQLEAATRKAEARLADMGPEFDRAARLVAARGQSSAPRRTGRLAASVRGSGDATGAAIKSALPYSEVIHWGWPQHGIEAQPWLSEAAQQTEPQWVGYFEELIDDLTTMMAAST